ncbi:16702_t:CDS:2 [Funneliformis geosporum]|uniref:16702_t:CDS:1 n=1 Tax=Funneliformis geosporum TaxID=1117311 RepID=A0A9W4X381_9GLOM|nr:16702_t:CDS:2 [Funneliformis geosporum]
MSNNPNNRFMNHPSGTYWRQVPIQPPAPSDPRVANQFQNIFSSHESDDSDNDTPRHNVIFDSSTNSPESSTQEGSPRTTPEQSSAMRMRMVSHIVPPSNDVEEVPVTTLDETNNENEMNDENIPQSTVQEDQSNERLRFYLAVLRQRVRELDSDAWMYVKVNNEFSKF